MLKFLAYKLYSFSKEIHEYKIDLTNLFLMADKEAAKMEQWKRQVTGSPAHSY